MFIKDRDRRYTHVNPAMLAILEMESAQIIGKRDEELFPAEWTTSMKSLDQRVLQGQPVESEQTLFCIDRPLTFNFVRFPMREPSGKIMGLCGIARDVTERRPMSLSVSIQSNPPARAS